jgi:hypothetical protein
MAYQVASAGTVGGVEQAGPSAGRSPIFSLRRHTSRYGVREVPLSPPPNRFATIRQHRRPNRRGFS